MSQQLLAEVESSSLKSEKPAFEIGDTVDVHNRILEGNKERIQVFTGVVIARSGAGRGLSSWQRRRCGPIRLWA